MDETNRTGWRGRSFDIDSDRVTQGVFKGSEGDSKSMFSKGERMVLKIMRRICNLPQTKKGMEHERKHGWEQGLLKG